MARMVLSILLSCGAVASAMEPNRYYQIVSNHLVDALAAAAADGDLTVDEAERAVALAAERAANRGPVVSRSNVDAKMAAGRDLLGHPGLSAMDKCIDMIHDLDVVAAYWSTDVPGQANPNPAAVIQEMRDANVKHRVKIDLVKQAMAAWAPTEEAAAATALAQRIADAAWEEQRVLRIVDDLRFSLRQAINEDLIGRIRHRLSSGALRRPLVLELMKRFDAAEMTRLCALEEEALELRAMRAALAMAPEAEQEAMHLIASEARTPARGGNTP